MKLLTSLADDASDGWSLCAVAGSMSWVHALSVQWNTVSLYTSEGFAPLSPGMSALEPVILELDLEQAHLDLGIATTLSYSSFH